MSDDLLRFARLPWQTVEEDWNLFEEIKPPLDPRIWIIGLTDQGVSEPCRYLEHIKERDTWGRLGRITKGPTFIIDDIVFNLVKWIYVPVGPNPFEAQKQKIDIQAFLSNRKIKEEDSTTWPDIGSYWRHYNGLVYEVKNYSNVDSNNPKHPITIIHMNIHNGKLYTRFVKDWERSFTKV